MKHIKLYEQFLNEAFDIKRESKKIPNNVKDKIAKFIKIGKSLGYKIENVKNKIDPPSASGGTVSSGILTLAKMTHPKQLGDDLEIFVSYYDDASSEESIKRKWAKPIEPKIEWDTVWINYHSGNDPIDDYLNNPQEWKDTFMDSDEMNEAVDIKPGDIIEYMDRPMFVSGIKGDDLQFEVLSGFNFKMPDGRRKTYYFKTGRTSSGTMTYADIADQKKELGKLSADVVFNSKKEALDAKNGAIQNYKDRLAAEKEEAKKIKAKEYRESRYTTREYEKILKGAMHDLVGDNPNAAWDSGYTYDTASSMIHDTKIADYIERTYDVYRTRDKIERLQWDLESFA